MFRCCKRPHETIFVWIGNNVGYEGGVLLGRLSDTDDVRPMRPTQGSISREQKQRP